MTPAVLRMLVEAAGAIVNEADKDDRRGLGAEPYVRPLAHIIDRYTIEVLRSALAAVEAEAKTEPVAWALMEGDEIAGLTNDPQEAVTWEVQEDERVRPLVYGDATPPAPAPPRVADGKPEPVVTLLPGHKPQGNHAFVEIVHSSDLRVDDVIWTDEGWHCVGEAPKDEDGAFEAALIVDDAGGIDRPVECFAGVYLRLTTPPAAAPSAERVLRDLQGVVSSLTGEPCMAHGLDCTTILGAYLRPMQEVVLDAMGWYFARWDREASKTLNRSVEALPDCVSRGLRRAAEREAAGAAAKEGGDGVNDDVLALRRAALSRKEDGSKAEPVAVDTSIPASVEAAFPVGSKVRVVRLAQRPKTLATVTDGLREERFPVGSVETVCGYDMWNGAWRLLVADNKGWVLECCEVEPVATTPSPACYGVRDDNSGEWHPIDPPTLEEARAEAWRLNGSIPGKWVVVPLYAAPPAAGAKGDEEE